MPDEVDPFSRSENDDHTMRNPSEVYKNLEVDLREEFQAINRQVDEAMANDKVDGLGNDFFPQLKAQYGEQYAGILGHIRHYLEAKLEASLAPEVIERTLQQIDIELARAGD